MSILDRLDASLVDLLLVMIIAAQFGLFVWRDSSCKDSVEKSEKRSKDHLLAVERRFSDRFRDLEARIDSRFESSKQKQKEDSDKFWTALEKLKDKYISLNAWAFGVSVAIRSFTGVKLLKQSADGKGETALNRDVE